MTIAMTPAMTEACRRFIRARDRMLARQISAMTAMTQPAMTAMTAERSIPMPFQYHFEISRSAWICTLDGHEIESFMTEEEAAAYCAYENGQQKNQTVGG